MELTGMRPKIITSKTAADAAHAAARFFAETASEEASRKGFFASAISGGETPRRMHRLLGKQPYLDSIPWKSVHIFWADERCVSADDPSSNYGAAMRDFLEKVPIPNDNIHSMPVSLSPDTAACVYGDRLKSFFSGRGYNEPVFDLIFLGLGSDGHTASIFPDSEADEKGSGKVAALFGGTPKVFRITLTIPIINTAQRVAFLVTGKDKSAIVNRIISDGGGLPAARVIPSSGNLMWFLDREAGSALESKEPYL